MSGDPGFEPSAQPLAQRLAQPLKGRRVIVTRSEADNKSLAGTLHQLGATVIEVPLTVVLPPQDGGVELRDAVRRLSQYRWLALTSPNGVETVAAAVAELDLTPTARSALLDQVVVAPVGPTTAAAARSHGFTVADPPPEATAAALVEAFPPGPAERGDRVLAPLAELASDTVVVGLEAKGYRVDRVTAYRTAAPPTDPARMAADVERAAGADAVTFFSPSAVDRFTDRFGGQSTDRFGGRASVESVLPGVVVCIGPSTAARAAERGLGRVLMASPHSEAGVVEQLVEALGRA
jgi:uroporphyrinogen-III synthase